MFNKFTNKSQEAIINAQIIAQDYGQQQIEALAYSGCPACSKAKAWSSRSWKS